ncbi:hypothetical protein EBX31_08965 [bacterium]|nr:hypothetical protein [bacterium]
MRRIENRAKADGSLIAYSTDSDGTWPSGVSTVNPNGGDTTPLVITSSDALLAPAIAASGTLSSLSTTYGTPSTSTQFSVSGANLREGILVTAPSSYEVSTDNSTFSSTVTVGSAGTIASTIVYVRLSAAATVAGSPYAGNIQLTSSGAASVNVATVSSTVAPQSISDSITLTPTGDGSYTASASGGVTFTYSYAGRTANGYATSYSASATAAAAPGYYTVTATSSNPNYTGSKSLQYFIEGLVANGGLTKPTDNQPFVIEQAGLLAKISRITSDGSLVAANLPVGSVATVTGLGGSSAQLDGTDILFTPTSSASDSVRVGISGFSELVTIVVSTEGSAPTFTLQIVKVGTAVYSSGNTTMTNDFIGVPNQSYAVEYSMDLTNWVSAGSVSTGATGSFSVTLSTAGNVVSDWNRAMFFRAKISATNP